LHHDEIQETVTIEAEEQPVNSIFAGVHSSGLSDEWLEKENEEVTREIDGLYSDMHPHLALVPSQTIDKPEPTVTREPQKQDAFVGKLLAIEVLCPNCGKDCADPKTGSLMITEDLIGHTVTCIECHTNSLVPLNAFSLAGSVVAREKPTTSGPNNKADKKGRTQKERKSNAGRKAKSGTVRQPRQLSLDVRTIKTLDAMKVNNSDLFETLLQQYEPFLNAWAEMGYEEHQGDEDE